MIAIALADARERTRRVSYLVVLLAAAAFGYLMLPDPAAGWQVVQIGPYGGRYTSAYIGTTVALAGVVWLALAGFFLVRGSVARDVGSGVGQVLAATPMRTTTYAVGKFLSNLAVLASIIGVLAGTGLVLQLWRGEAAVDPVALVVPLLVIAAPAMAAIAALALVFDTVPLLRGGLGNVVWFFCWMVGIVAAQDPRTGTDVLGLGAVSRSMLAAIAAQHGDTHDMEVGIGLVKRDEPLVPFLWDGADFSTSFLASRVVAVALAVGIAAVTAVWFHRFDLPVAAPRTVEEPVVVEPAAASFARVTLPSAPVVRGWPAGVLLAAEVRILLSGLSRWWWLGAGGLLASTALLPTLPGVTAALQAAWIWPVLVWSRMGTAARAAGVESLLVAYPTARLRLATEWLACVALTAVIGGPALLRMLFAGDGPGAAAWLGGCLFIPAFALALGTVSGSPRLFQLLYLAIAWTGLNGAAALDVVGYVRVDGVPAGPSLPVLGPAAAVLLAVTFAVSGIRHRVR